MSLEDKLSSWTGPSSDTEQQKQERTERMIREALDSHEPLKNCNLKIYAKGSYANNTNVRSDSDVDIAVECKDVIYWEADSDANHTPGEPYDGEWTPSKLRKEIIDALNKKFLNQVDTTGSTAIQINSSTARVEADVVPCFSYLRYMKYGNRSGTKIFKTDASSIVNFPSQQLTNGTAKNVRTGYLYKRGVRLLKRIENAMAKDGVFRELPSFFMECLAYNCPDSLFAKPTWTERLCAMLIHIFESLQGEEPESNRWLEVNECYYLFHSGQKWSRKDGRDFAEAAWYYFGFDK